MRGADVSIRYEDGVQQVYLNGENVTGMLRTKKVGNMASKTSAIPEVREKLLELQRTLAKENDVIMDGRDIGTNILPDADVKIYLTASVETRAKRRYDELKEKGEDCDLEQIARDIKERDERDMNRETAPLKQADDAILVGQFIHDDPGSRIRDLQSLQLSLMKVIKAKSAGFCFGVKRAVDTVYEQAKTCSGPIYTYGPIIHNEEVVKDLEQKGVAVLRSEEDLDHITEGTVIIRSHGVEKRICDKLEAKASASSTPPAPLSKKSIILSGKKALPADIS